MTIKPSDIKNKIDSFYTSVEILNEIHLNLYKKNKIYETHLMFCNNIEYSLNQFLNDSFQDLNKLPSGSFERKSSIKHVLIKAASSIFKNIKINETKKLSYYKLNPYITVKI